MYLQKARKTKARHSVLLSCDFDEKTPAVKGSQSQNALLIQAGVSKSPSK